VELLVVRSEKGMENNECTIYIIMTKSGWKQVYRKKKDYWTQRTNGVVRKMTAEQLLSHILPPLAAGKKSRVMVKVVKDRKVKK
jgi:hypothetical protein